MWNRTTGNEITIHRKRKHEAEMAINDLLNRGYELTYPLTEKTSVGTSRDRYNLRYQRYTSKQTITTSVWFAKMKRVVNQ